MGQEGARCGVAVPILPPTTPSPALRAAPAGPPMQPRPN